MVKQSNTAKFSFFKIVQTSKVHLHMMYFFDCLLPRNMKLKHIFLSRCSLIKLQKTKENIAIVVAWLVLALKKICAKSASLL